MWQRAVVLPDTSVDQFHGYILRLNNANTAGKYRLAAQKFVQFCAYNRLVLENLPRGALSFFSETLVANGLKPSSVSVMTHGAKRYLRWLEGHGAIPVTNLTSPDLPKINKVLPNALKDNDLLAFFSFATKCPEPVRTALLLLPYCGLRSNELTTLKMDAVKRVPVNNADGSKAMRLGFIVKGKGGDQRYVPLLLDGEPILRAYVSGWRRAQPGDFLFPMGDGTSLSNRTLRHYVQWVREKMKANGRDVGRVTPHTMRRTYITTLWRSGLDVPTLTKIAGHKSVQTTMTHYLEMRPEDLAGAVGGMTLVAKGEYADSVRAAQADVNAFLSSLKK